MKLLKVGTGKYVNTEGITYIEAKKRDKVIIQSCIYSTKNLRPERGL